MSSTCCMKCSKSLLMVPGKIHHMTGITIADRGKDKNVFWSLLAGSEGNAGWTNEVHIEWKMRAMLFDGATGNDADLAEINGIIDLRPGEFFVAVFGFGA